MIDAFLVGICAFAIMSSIPNRDAGELLLGRAKFAIRRVLGCIHCARARRDEGKKRQC